MKSLLTENPPTPIDRRSLLKTGFWGGIFLASASLGAGLSGCATTPSGKVEQTAGTTGDYHYRFLSDDDLVLLSAITPTILAPHFSDRSPSQILAQKKLLSDIDTAIYYFSDANQQEVRKLFDLLNFAPTRALLGGVWSSWDNTTDDEVNTFLNDWKYSSLPLLNKAYAALAKIVTISWYIQPEHWQDSGYAGPPASAIKALPQFADNALS